MSEDLGAEYAQKMFADIELTPQDEEKIWELLEDVRVKFWCCPEDHPKEPQRVTVKWDGNIATCQDCGRTNAG
jgi:hypothetical protein